VAVVCLEDDEAQPIGGVGDVRVDLAGGGGDGWGVDDGACPVGVLPWFVPDLEACEERFEFVPTVVGRDPGRNRLAGPEWASSSPPPGLPPPYATDLPGRPPHRRTYPASESPAAHHKNELHCHTTRRL